MVAEAPRIARVIMSEVGDFPSTKTLAVHLPQRLCPPMFVMSCPLYRKTQWAICDYVVPYIAFLRFLGHVTEE